MKSLTRIFLVLALAVAVPSLKLYAQKSFEGTVTWSMSIPMTGDDEKHPMVVNIKGHKSEIEMDMGVAGNFKIYTDQDAKKSYMVVNPSMGFVSDIKSSSDSTVTASDVTNLKPTGKTETIAGYKAEEYELTGLQAYDKVSIWVTPDIPKEISEGIHNALQNPSEDPKQTRAMSQLLKKGLAPVRIQASKDGETAMTMEFVKYEAKPMDDALFVPPASIKFQPMPQMGGHGGMN